MSAVSQEIENSSNSTRNSKKKCPLARSIFKSGQASGGTQYLLTTATVPRLPLVEKRDYIENWILSSAAHSSRETPRKPYSPSKSITRDKRVAVSPIQGHRWKRAKGEVIVEATTKIRTNEKSLVNPEVRISGGRIDCNFSPPSTRRLSRRLDFTDSLANEALKSNPQIQGHETLRKNHCELSSETQTKTQTEIIEGERVTTQDLKNSPKMKDRVTCKFSWHRSKKNRPRRSLELDGICDKTRGQELFYWSREFPPSIMSESAEIKNCITKGFDEDSQVNSPLRWNGYESKIRKFPKCSDTLSLSSPIIDSERMIQSTSTSDVRDHFIQETNDDKISSVHFSPVTNTKFSQDESPQRWNGYDNESHNFSKFTDFASFSRSETEPIHSDSTSDFQEQNFAKEGTKPALSPRSNEGQTAIGVSEKITDAVSQPLSIIASERLAAPCKNFSRKNGSQGHESSKLPETASLFTPLMEGCEVIQSSSCNEPENQPIRKNQNTRLVSLRAERERKRISDEASQRSNKPLSLGRDLSKCPKRDLSSPVENMDVESLTTIPPDEDIGIESDSDVTDPVENFRRENSIQSASRRDRSRSCDSDETYCTNGNPVVHSQQEINFSLKSQRISHLTANSHDDARVLRSKSELISPTSSPLINVSKPSILHISTANLTRNKANRTKKAKKGSLLAKLQTLVSHQTASFQLWQYKVSRIDDKPSHFVKFAIMKRETRYGRHYLIGTIIEDFHNLLKSLSEERETTIISPDEKLLTTLVVVPEISGTLKLGDVSTIRIYPPWQIIDRERRALRIIYFDADTRSDETKLTLSKNRRVTKTVRILDNFECPCLLNREIDRSCRMKFNNTKPSVMTAIFANR